MTAEQKSNRAMRAANRFYGAVPKDAEETFFCGRRKRRNEYWLNVDMRTNERDAHREHNAAEAKRLGVPVRQMARRNGMMTRKEQWRRMRSGSYTEQFHYGFEAPSQVVDMCFFTARAALDKEVARLMEAAAGRRPALPDCGSETRAPSGAKADSEVCGTKPERRAE